MPYIPDLGTNGRVLDLVHASFNNLISPSISSGTTSPSSSTSNPFDPSLSYLHQGLQENNILTMRSLGSYSAINATALYSMEQQQARQIVATASSSLSLLAALVSVFWFFMMRRNFRRDLVLLLILGGAFKSLWFVVFSVYSFVHGQVETETAFCQANGYLLQVGFEQCDAAVLFMSMHMYYQIFPNQRFGLSHDGLYRVRKWVYAAWILLPNLSAALAFVNPRSAFMAQGGFCSLPLRPYWYRIALFWGPRYLAWCYVVFVAVRIYRYVGSEFEVFGQERDRSSSLGVPGNSSVDRMMKLELDPNQGRRHSKSWSSFGIARKDDVGCAPDDTSGSCALPSKTIPSTDSAKINLEKHSRRQSATNWTNSVPAISEDTAELTPPMMSYPSSRRGSQQIGNGVTAEDFAPPPAIDSNRHRGSITNLGSKKSSAGASFDMASGLPSITERPTAPVRVDSSRPTASGAMRLRRRLVQRQLRLLFIYPCIYMLLWVIPLVMNIMNYTDYFAQHPVFPLSIVQLLCITLMTFADVLVFCWRERPWRHIPGSDGTFSGSLMFWRYCFGTQWHADRRASRVQRYIPDEKDNEDEESQSKTGLIGSWKKWSLSQKTSSPRASDAGAAKIARPQVHRRNYSGGSERKHMEAERAAERLALERQDYEDNRRSLQERRVSVVSQQHGSIAAAATSQGRERKEWFDQDGDLFKDVDLEEGNEKRSGS